ncbi:DUF1616 domain-containing protein [Chloroflexota bacterium]
MDWLSPIREIFEFAFPLLERLSIVRALLGFILVFFVPGFAWTLVFFKQINIIERIALSLGLSIALVTLSLFALNRMVGTSVTGLNAVLVIIVLTVIPLVFYYLNRIRRDRLSRRD